MSRHIPPGDNQNRPIVGVGDETTPLCYFNHVRLKRGETFLHQVDGYESMPVTEAAQEVQRSGFPEAYADHEQDGRVLASALTGNSRAAFW